MEHWIVVNTVEERTYVTHSHKDAYTLIESFIRQNSNESEKAYQLRCLSDSYFNSRDYFGINELYYAEYVDLR